MPLKTETVDTASAFFLLIYFLLSSDSFSNLVFLQVSRGLITATCDGLFPALIFIDFSVGSGFLDHLCLLKTHLPSLGDTLMFFFSSSDFC